jgi:Ni/Fe-hydrogenase subunit HybB-like protein
MLACIPKRDGDSWTELIVIYPYITGLVAGAFVVSSLHRLAWSVSSLFPDLPC